MPQPRQLAESKGSQSRWALAILCLVLCLQVLFGERGKWGRRHARDVLMLRQGGDDDGGQLA